MLLFMNKTLSFSLSNYRLNFIVKNKTYQNINTVRADESDNDGSNSADSQTGVLEGSWHRKDTRSKR